MAFRPLGYFVGKDEGQKQIQGDPETFNPSTAAEVVAKGTAKVAGPRGKPEVPIRHSQEKGFSAPVRALLSQELWGGGYLTGLTAPATLTITRSPAAAHE